jgi:hypothetical protein
VATAHPDLDERTPLDVMLSEGVPGIRRVLELAKGETG